MQLVVGLGNPGPRYADTRHNVGFMVVDALARLWKARRIDLDLEAEVAAVPAASVLVTSPEETAGEAQADLLLVKPMTYMNLSGVALEQLKAWRSFEPQDVLVIVDDIYLPFGQLRLRTGGTDAGHNGLTSIHASLGTLEVPRLRCGVGPVPEGVDYREFVTEPFGESEAGRLNDFIDRAARVVRAVLEQGVARAQNEVALANKGVTDA